MALTPRDALDTYNNAINTLVLLRDRFKTYGDDWATLPAGVKTAVRSNFSLTITSVKIDLDAVNATVQGL